MSSRRIHLALAAVLVLGLVATSIAVAAGRDHGNHKGKQDDQQFTAHLIGYNEVPSLNSGGQADLSLVIGTGQLTFTLTYSGLSGPPTAAHVHVGQPGVNGGVSFFFCGGGGKPACPASTSGSVTGTVAPADVVGPTAQGFPAGSLDPVVAAIRAGFTYANMHTVAFPNGEIRGQVGPAHGHDGSDDDD